MAANKSVLLRGDPVISDEWNAGGTITPGHLLTFSSGNVVVHATSGGNAIPMFALERTETGRDLTDTYASGDRVKTMTCYTGCQVNAILGASQTIAVGDLLMSGGSGQLIAHAAQTDTDGMGAPAILTKKIVARALEAVTTGAGATARIRVQIV